MAKAIIDVINQSTNFSKQIEFSIDDDLVADNLSTLSCLINKTVKGFDSDLKIKKVKLIANIGIF